MCNWGADVKKLKETKASTFTIHVMDRLQTLILEHNTTRITVAMISKQNTKCILHYRFQNMHVADEVARQMNTTQKLHDLDYGKGRAVWACIPYLLKIKLQCFSMNAQKLTHQATR